MEINGIIFFVSERIFASFFSKFVMPLFLSVMQYFPGTSPGGSKTVSIRTIVSEEAGRRSLCMCMSSLSVSVWVLFVSVCVCESCLYVSLFVCLSVCVSVCLSVCLSEYLYLTVSVWVYQYLSVCLFDCVCVCVSVCGYVCLCECDCGLFVIFVICSVGVPQRKCDKNVPNFQSSVWFCLYYKTFFF